jgi:hypothetical protein
MGGDVGSIATQGRIVFDPGGDAAYGLDYAPIIGNVASGYLRIEPGLDPAGIPREILLSDVLEANVRVGSTFDDSRFSINGMRDQPQMVIRGHTTQNANLFQVDTSSRHMFDIKPFGVVAVGDDNWGGLLAVDGYQDRIQLNVKGHSTQTRPLAMFEKDDGTDIFSVANGSTIRLNPIDNAPSSCSQGELYMDTSGAFCVCTSTNTWTNTTGIGSCT